MIIRQESLAVAMDKAVGMASKGRGKIPQQFDLSMWAEARELWCAWMLPVILMAWPLSGVEFCLLLIFAAVLVLIGIYDMRYGLIYDRLVLSLLLLGSLPLAAGRGEPMAALTGALLGSGLLAGLRYLSRGGLGLGDVKLAVALGVWLGWADMLLCLLLSACSGLLYGSVLLLRQRIRRDTPLPFGPFLALGALLAFSWGQVIWDWIEAWLW